LGGGDVKEGKKATCGGVVEKGGILKKKPLERGS